MFQSTHTLSTPVFSRWLAICALVLGLSACAGEGGPGVDSDVRSAENMYAEAEQLAEDGQHRQAAKAFDEVERLHPTSKYAKPAILASATSSYRHGDYDRAITAASRYLDFYPSDARAAEAQYLVALSHYDQITDVGRDQARTVAALQSLKQLIARYPNSEYRREAELKVELALDHLAGKEMEVGRFYLQRGQYIAAINRFRVVIEQYQTTAHTAEALHRLVEAYLALGVVSEAQTAAAVLGHNFPGSQWYQDSYALLTGAQLEPQEDEESWISRSWGAVSDIL